MQRYYNVLNAEANVMVEGFWILQIKTPQYTSGGVCIFLNGKIFGGDSGFTWVGTYAGDEIPADVTLGNVLPCCVA